jgi:hypothetical protein
MTFLTYVQHNGLRHTETFADLDAALHRVEDLWAAHRIARLTVETTDEHGALVVVHQAVAQLELFG